MVSLYNRGKSTGIALLITMEMLHWLNEILLNLDVLQMATVLCQYVIGSHSTVSIYHN